MLFVLLIHWNAAERRERLARLESAGLRAAALEVADGATALRTIREAPPDAVIIDLSRLPSHGRETALALRQSKVTRAIPIVFVDGEPEKVAAIRSGLPDATYTKWTSIGRAVQKAIGSTPQKAKAPDLSRGYSGTPLPKKLGIANDSTLKILNGPPGFVDSLGVEACGVTIRVAARGSAAIVILFVASRKDLTSCIGRAVKSMANPGALWIAWPKKSSGVLSDLSDSVIREAGLEAGLVDTKVCAIDATWSGLRFNRRVAKK